VRRALVVAYDGNPLTAAAPRATMERPQTLLRRQVGHAILGVRGLDTADIVIRGIPAGIESLYLQVCSLDHHGQLGADTKRLDLARIRDA
jgi:hypothetical protein